VQHRHRRAVRPRAEGLRSGPDHGTSRDPAAAEFYAVDIIETLRQGLIGGGKGIVNGVEVKVTPVLANTLIKNLRTRPPAGRQLEHGRGDPRRLHRWVRPAKKRRARRASGRPNLRDDGEDGRLDYGLALTNCSMMNIPPDEARRMSLWEYEARLYHWNEAHEVKDEVEAPDPEMVMPLLDRINADPRLTH
jgi:hypothetical protein